MDVIEDESAARASPSPSCSLPAKIDIPASAGADFAYYHLARCLHQHPHIDHQSITNDTSHQHRSSTQPDAAIARMHVAMAVSDVTADEGAAKREANEE